MITWGLLANTIYRRVFFQQHQNCGKERENKGEDNKEAGGMKWKISRKSVFEVSEAWVLEVWHCAAVRAPALDRFLLSTSSRD